MLLAPTTELVRVHQYNKFMKVTLPTFSPDLFARFKHYSIFVHKIKFSNTWPSNEFEFLSLKLQPWTTLSLQAQHGPLLPNLRELQFSGLLHYSERDQFLLWISAFVSPSVDTLSISTNFDGRLSQQLTADVLSLLTQRAPRLKKLTHNLTIQPPRHEDSEQSAASWLALSPVTCDHLQSLQHLAHLAIEGGFIDLAIFSELSRLPNLEYLSIFQGHDHNKMLSSIFENAQLLLGSFPSLRTLQLISDTLDDIVAAWKATPLVSGLTAVSLQYSRMQIRRGPDESIYDHRVLRLILPSISKSSPYVKQLTMGSRYGG
ncbi:hypothetical protein FRC12_005257 [Ceratobasidium sp. 428]|nr:hypothetical protein FRC12_005257 [Ceratobasidium sp. 428]